MNTKLPGTPRNSGGWYVCRLYRYYLKLKAKDSGYPAWVRTPADEERYIESFWKSEWIRLDREAIKPNAAKCGMAKLCLNSIWGKLTERNDRMRTKIITETHELYRFLPTPGVELTNLALAFRGNQGHDFGTGRIRC